MKQIHYTMASIHHKPGNRFFFHTLFFTLLISVVVQPVRSLAISIPKIPELTDSTGPGHLQIVFHYLRNESTPDPAFAGNAGELSKVDALLARQNAGEIEILYIDITGHSSIEGTYIDNDELSRRRAEKMQDYLKRTRPFFNNASIDLDWKGEDWENLSSLVFASSMPHRDEVLRIIAEVDIFDGRETRLMILHYGNPYRYMEELFFPQLRRTQISIHYRELPQILEPDQSLPQTNITDVQPEPEPETALSVLPVQQQEDEPRGKSTRQTDASQLPVGLALKTNLLLLATASPNLAVEIGLGPQFTLDLGVSYNPFDLGNNRKWKHLFIQPELRWWTRGAFDGHFLGVHSHWVDFNAARVPIIAGIRNERAQGMAFGLGLSYGYQHWFNANWGMEYIIGLGYTWLDYTKYECRTCGEKLKKDTKNYFGPTRAAVSIIYKF